LAFPHTHAELQQRLAAIGAKVYGKAFGSCAIKILVSRQAQDFRFDACGAERIGPVDIHALMSAFGGKAHMPIAPRNVRF